MTLEEAKALLGTLHRDSLWDGTFGDEEVYWTRGGEEGEEVACGYFGRDTRSVEVGDTTFEGDAAEALRHCGKSFSRERNDEG